MMETTAASRDELFDEEDPVTAQLDLQIKHDLQTYETCLNLYEKLQGWA